MGRCVEIGSSLSVAFALLVGVGVAEEKELGPYDHQVAQNVAKLGSSSPTERAGAAEALGYLRAYTAEQALVQRLQDDSAALP